jgi:hypothetical protein
MRASGQTFRRNGTEDGAKELLAVSDGSPAAQLGDWRSEFDIEDRVRHCDGLIGRRARSPFRMPRWNEWNLHEQGVPTRKGSPLTGQGVPFPKEERQLRQKRPVSEDLVFTISICRTSLFQQKSKLEQAVERIS